MADQKWVDGARNFLSVPRAAEDEVSALADLFEQIHENSVAAATRQVVLDVCFWALLWDHTGDAWNDIGEAARRVGIELPDECNDGLPEYETVRKMGARNVRQWPEFANA